MYGRNGASSNISFGNGCNQSHCTAPAETNHMAGWAWEPVGHAARLQDGPSDR